MKDINLVVVRGQDWQFGDIGKSQDVEMVVQNVLDMYTRDGGMITREDLEIQYENIAFAKEMQTYSVFETIGKEVEGYVNLKLDLSQAQKVINLSKQIPGYTQDHLYKTLDLVDAQYIDFEPKKLYW